MLQTKVLYQRGLFLEAPGSLTTQPVSCLPTRAQRAWDGASVRGNTAVRFYSADVLFYSGFRDNTLGNIRSVQNASGSPLIRHWLSLSQFQTIIWVLSYFIQPIMSYFIQSMSDFNLYSGKKQSDSRTFWYYRELLSWRMLELTPRTTSFRLRMSLIELYKFQVYRFDFSNDWSWWYDWAYVS